MKKLIALILAIVMMAAMSLVVFADQTLADTDDPINGQEEDTKITYTVLKGYIVTIPDDFDLTVNDEDDGTSYGTGTGEVAIMKAKLNGGETLTVSAKGNAVTGNNYAGAAITNEWMLKAKNDSASVGYDIKVTGAKSIDKLEQNQIIVDYTSGEAISSAGRISTLAITTEKTPQAGIFEDTITFTVAIVTA